MINIWNSHIEKISDTIKHMDAKIEEFNFVNNEIGLTEGEAKVLKAMKIHAGNCIISKGNMELAAIRVLTGWEGEAYRISGGVAVREV